jgi:hypothetical protein
MKILYNYPSRSRPALFRRGVESIIENSDSANFEILAIVDDNDLTLKEYNFEGCTVLLGSSKSKVDAINRGHQYILNSNADIIVNMSDDMMFTKKGFDSDIMNAIGNNWDQVIHFPDGTTGDKLISLSILGMEYYSRFNYIYHPDYCSVYCDNETMDVAKILNCYKFINENIFVHLHPANGNAFNDEQYRYTESFHPIDQATYFKRKAMNYGL